MLKKSESKQSLTGAGLGKGSNQSGISNICQGLRKTNAREAFSLV